MWQIKFNTMESESHNLAPHEKKEVIFPFAMVKDLFEVASKSLNQSSFEIYTNPERICLEMIGIKNNQFLVLMSWIRLQRIDKYLKVKPATF